MSAVMSAIPCLEINQILLSGLNTAVRSILTKCAHNINDNFDELKEMNSDDRLEAIINMFGLDVDTTAKIIKPAPKKNADGTTPKKTGKPKTEKPLPLPFWGEQTVDKTKCHGLQAGLYNQCCNTPLDGGIYCKNCQKDADNNGGMPKRGNIEIRLKQFKRNSYEYTTPDNKPRKIYIKLWAEKKELSMNDVRAHFAKYGIELDEDELDNVFYMPEKKSRLTKKNLTGEMKQQKKKKNDDTQSDVGTVVDFDVPEDDDNKSVIQDDDQYQDQDQDQDQDVPDDDDDDDDALSTTPDVPEVFDTANFNTIVINTIRYGALKTNLDKYKKDKTQEIEIYEVADYVSKTDFRIVSRFGVLCNNKVRTYC
jgi:hypothetical protein